MKAPVSEPLRNPSSLRAVRADQQTETLDAAVVQVGLNVDWQQHVTAAGVCLQTLPFNGRLLIL